MAMTCRRCRTGNRWMRLDNNAPPPAAHVARIVPTVAPGCRPGGSDLMNYPELPAVNRIGLFVRRIIRNPWFGSRMNTRSQLRGALPKRGKNRFRLCRVSGQSGHKQADGEAPTDGAEPAGSPSPAPNPDPRVGRAMGSHHSELVSRISAEVPSGGQDRCLTPAISRSRDRGRSGDRRSQISRCRWRPGWRRRRRRPVAR
jgi:hypothetical protein